MQAELIAGLLAGIVSAGQQTQSPAAQDATAPAQSPSPTVPQTAPPPAPTPAPPPRVEFRGADGKPLPPELQRQLQEQFRTNPPPINTAPPPGADGRDVVVSGQRPRGSVVGDIPPERTFNPVDIRAYGAATVEELLGALGPQLSSNRGRDDGGPIVLLNGKRVSSFAEIAHIPPEAIQRMEVFPEELALKYGYRADQKVVNVVVYERYNGRVGQLGYSLPTEGGRDSVAASANYLRIRGDTRVNVDSEYSRSGSLLESERDLQQASATPDAGRFRTLLPANERFVLNGTVSAPVLSGVSSTLNARYEATGSDSLLGLGGAGPLRRDTDTHNAHLGTALGGAVSDWQWSFTGNYDRISTATLTDTATPGTRDEARSVNALASADLVLNGAPLTLPAGPVTTSFHAGGAIRDFTSRSLRGDVAQRTDLSRDRGAFQADLDVPITSRGHGPDWLGAVTVNANLEVEQLSDFGTLRTLGYGLRWSPIAALNLIASVTDEEGAPSVEQLGGPLIVTPNVRTFDFTRREAVDITRVSGGNAGLRADDRHVLRLGLNARPFARKDLTLSLDFTSTRIDDPIAAFPIATPAIETAFPERFTRDIGGRLLRIDSRPLNFARSEQEQLRWGVNFTRTLGALPPGMQNANVRFTGPMSEAELKRRYPGATIMRIQPGGPMSGAANTLQSRLIFSLYHTWRFEDELLVRPGVPVLDLLDGAAVGSRGGRPRHEVEFQAGAFRQGLGGRVTATWQSGTNVRGLPAGDLRFGSYATVNVDLFANLADRFGGAKAPTWLKGTRASLGVNNLFNARADVRDDLGATPFAYQPAYLDPLGRSVTFSLRKVF